MEKDPFKTVLVANNIAGASGRDTLSGIFAFVNGGKSWRLKLLASPNQIPELLKTGERIDGLIVRYPEDPAAVRALAAVRVPVVCTNLRNPSAPLRRNRTAIALDDAAIGREAADFFASLGSFGSYAYVTNRHGFVWSDERGAAFADRLRTRHGVYACYMLTLDDKEAVERFLRDAAKPLAVFASWDMAALEVLEACRKLGLAVPAQVAVLGVDNEELVCNGAKPTLSSIEPDHVELGRQACVELERLLRSEPGRTIRIAKAIRAIHRRESTAVVPPSERLVLRAQKFIRENAGRGLTPAEVVRHLGVSRSLAFLRFRERTGETLGAVIVRERIAKIKRLLGSSGNRISDVAAACGFADGAALTRFFKRETGLAPKQWRAKNNPR